MRMGSASVVPGLVVLLCLTLFVVPSDALKCYDCDSTHHAGCSDDDYVDHHYLRDCPIRIALNQIYCLKEITTFPEIEQQNRNTRPHIVRRCGPLAPPNSRWNQQSNYYQQQDRSNDGCDRINVVVNTYKGERRTCACDTDACNKSIPSRLPAAEITMGLGLLTMLLNRYYF